MSRRAAVKLFAGAAISLTLAPALACRASQREDETHTPGTSLADLAPPQLIRQIDHILLRTDDAQSLFDRLSNDLALPVAWPIFTYRGFLSGALGFGNVNLEVLQRVDGDAPAFAAAPGTYPIGLAFEPVTVDDAVRELDARGLAHSVPFDDGITDTIRWTSIDLTGPAECPIMLFVKYSFDQDARRAQLGQQLREQGGGPLGVTSVLGVEIGVRDMPSADARWQNLFAPDASAPRWHTGSGPEFSLIESEADRFERVVLAVSSLAAAADAARKRDILADATDTYADIDLGDGHRPLRLVEA
jgi:hypothetical protein